MLQPRGIVVTLGIPNLLKRHHLVVVFSFCYFNVPLTVGSAQRFAIVRAAILVTCSFISYFSYKLVSRLFPIIFITFL